MLTEAERAQLKTIIELHIAKAEVDIEGLEEATQPVAPENSIGRISRMDAIHNKSVAEVSLRETKNRLKRLHVALSKIYSPAFGKCMCCSEYVPMGRLEFMPHATRYVNCM